MDLGNNNKSVEAQKMDNKYSTRSDFLENVTVDKFNENEARQYGSYTNGKQAERRKWEKVKTGYKYETNQIKLTLVLRSKKIFQNI